MSNEITVRGSYGSAIIVEPRLIVYGIRWDSGDSDGFCSGAVTTPWCWAGFPGIAGDGNWTHWSNGQSMRYERFRPRHNPIDATCYRAWITTEIVGGR